MSESEMDGADLKIQQEGIPGVIPAEMWHTRHAHPLLSVPHWICLKCGTLASRSHC